MEIVDQEEATVRCEGPHDASITVSATYDARLRSDAPSVIGTAAQAAEVCGWRRTDEGWLCPICLGTA